MVSREQQRQVAPSDGDAGEDVGRVVRAHLAQQQVRNEILQMNSQEDWRRVVFRLWQEVSEWVPFDACGINLVDAQTREWVYYAVDAEGRVEVNRPGELAPAIEQAMETGTPAYRTDRADPLMADMAPEVQSVIDVPFLGGTLALNSTRPKAWTEDQVALLEQFAGVMAEGCLRLADLKVLEDQAEELRRHRDHLEVMVQARTQELEAAMDKVQRQADEIMELATPILQIRAGIVVAPLIGNLDGGRAQRLMEVLLQQIVSTRSSTALIDITGVPAIDTATAQNLIEAVTAVRLLGARVVLTGVRPVIAQTLVQLGIDLREIETFATLADGLRSMPLSETS